MATPPHRHSAHLRGAIESGVLNVGSAPGRQAHDPARLTPHGLRIEPGIDFNAWITMGYRITRISNACAWCLGDWLVYGQERFSDRYRSALRATSLDYQTLRNYAWVARRFELSRRRDSLSFQHHAEVASLSDAEQNLWLLRAEREKWSRNELRRKLRTERQSRLTGSADGAVLLSIEVTRTREQRWRRAAQAADQPFTNWVTAAADAAADAQMDGSPATGPPHPAPALRPS